MSRKWVQAPSYSHDAGVYYGVLVLDGKERTVTSRSRRGIWSVPESIVLWSDENRRWEAVSRVTILTREPGR